MIRIALAALLVLAVAACGSGGDDGEDVGGGGGGGGDAQTIEIVGTEFALEPATVELDEPGTYGFVFRNDGGAVHALEIDGAGIEAETEEIGGGETAELTVELTEEGEYELYCPVGNHRDQGMEGTVVVGGAAGGGAGTDETTTDETTTEDDDYRY